MFTISSVKATRPRTYTIKDTLGEPVYENFYAQERQSSVQEFFVWNENSKRGKTKYLSSGKVTVTRSIRGYHKPILMMNINKQNAWQPAEDTRENNHLLPRNLRGLVIGKLQRSLISCFNPVDWTTTTCKCLERVFINKMLD